MNWAVDVFLRFVVVVCFVVETAPKMSCDEPVVVVVSVGLNHT